MNFFKKNIFKNKLDKNIELYKNEFGSCMYGIWRVSVEYIAKDRMVKYHKHHMDEYGNETNKTKYLKIPDYIKTKTGLRHYVKKNSDFLHSRKK